MTELSKKRLSTCHVRLQDLFNEVDRHYPCLIITGHRGEADQNKAFAEGKSKERWPMGKHNSLPSLAVDVAPEPLDWKNTKKFYEFIGFVRACAIFKRMKIRCGHDWDMDGDLNDQTFNDLVHFEYLGEL